MRLAGARALIARQHPLHVEQADASRDQAALHALAAWALELSPVVAEDPPDGLLLDGHGLARLFGGEATWMEHVVERVSRLGIHVRAAVADTIGCAWAVARHGPSPRAVVASGSERKALAPLPVASLRIDAKIVDALHEIGVDRVEHLDPIPRESLARRFGDEILLRLDQATGAALELVRSHQTAQPLYAQITFDGPVRDLEAVQAAVDRLASSLCAKLQHRLFGAFEVVLRLERCEAGPIEHTLTPTRATTDGRHVAHLLRNKIERTCLAAGIERMRLTASKISPLDHRQHHITHGASGPPSQAADDLVGRPTSGGLGYGALLDRLIERCGRRRVVQAGTVPSYIPERAFGMQPLSEPRSCEPVSLVASERPSVLYDRPVPAEAISLLPDGAPAWLGWRGGKVEVVRAFGPERIGAPWWTRRDMTKGCSAYRDYFKVLDERGRWLWVFRSVTTGRWFVHGEWA